MFSPINAQRFIVLIGVAVLATFCFCPYIAASPTQILLANYSSNYKEASFPEDKIFVQQDDPVQANRRLKRSALVLGPNIYRPGPPRSTHKPSSAKTTTASHTKPHTTIATHPSKTIVKATSISTSHPITMKRPVTTTKSTTIKRTPYPPKFGIAKKPSTVTLAKSTGKSSATSPKSAPPAVKQTIPARTTLVNNKTPLFTITKKKSPTLFIYRPPTIVKKTTVIIKPTTKPTTITMTSHPTTLKHTTTSTSPVSATPKTTTKAPSKTTTKKRSPMPVMYRLLASKKAKVSTKSPEKLTNATPKPTTPTTTKATTPATTPEHSTTTSSPLVTTAKPGSSLSTAVTHSPHKTTTREKYQTAPPKIFITDCLEKLKTFFLDT